MLPGLKAIDWLGSAAILGMTIMLLLGLEFGGAVFPWDSAKVLGLVIGGVVMGGVFVLVEKKWASYPLVPLDAFRKRTNVACFALGYMHGAVSVALSLTF